MNNRVITELLNLIEELWLGPGKYPEHDAIEHATQALADNKPETFIFVSGGIAQDVLDRDGNFANSFVIDYDSQEGGACPCCDDRDLDGDKCEVCGWEEGEDYQVTINRILSWE